MRHETQIDREVAAVSPMMQNIVFDTTVLDQTEQAMRSVKIPDTPPLPGVDIPDLTTQQNNLNSVMQQIMDFNRRHSVVVGSGRASQPRRAIVDSIEIKTDSPGQVEATLDALQQEPWKQEMQSLQVFLEIDCQTDPTESIRSLAKTTRPKTFTKIRTGGITPEQIPSLEQVARFIECCSRHGVGFKATAGLHHPLRGEYRLTYEQNPPRGNMHGFLNVFVATLMAFEHHLDRQTIQEILAERDFSQFHFDEDRLQWRDFSIAANRIIELRNSSIQSFGSCSFDEPTLELQTHLENPGKQ
jgi:hypothetical protein